MLNYLGHVRACGWHGGAGAKAMALQILACSHTGQLLMWLEVCFQVYVAALQLGLNLMHAALQAKHVLVHHPGNNVPGARQSLGAAALAARTACCHPGIWFCAA